MAINFEKILSWDRKLNFARVDWGDSVSFYRKPPRDEWENFRNEELVLRADRASQHYIDCMRVIGNRRE